VNVRDFESAAHGSAVAHDAPNGSQATISRTIRSVNPVEAFMHDASDTPRQEDPRAQLERAFIEEYLRSRQYSLDTLKQLPADEADALLHQASLFASGRLAEVESRAHLVDELHRVPELPGRQPHGGTEDTAAQMLPDVSPPPHPPTPVEPRRRPLRWPF
jgi:hypothetical protein